MNRNPGKTDPVADYDEARQAFAALLQADCSQPILLLRGESGKGKTTLLRVCMGDLPAGVFCVPIQLRSTVGVAEIYSRTGDQLGWERWRNFTARVAALTDTPRIQIDSNWLAGINNHINVALQAENPLDREQRRVNLTEAWFEDARAFERSLLMVMDTYEQASTEMAEWLSGPFLARAARTTQLRLVIAGREVPDPNNIEWGHCCNIHNLQGVPEARYWLPVVDALGLRTPSEPALTFLEGLCHACEGRPDEIMKWVKRFPRREPEAVL